jgi:hypothetical protein
VIDSCHHGPIKYIYWSMVFVLFYQYCDETPGICKKLGMYRAKYDDMPIPQKSISIFRTKIGANYSGFSRLGASCNVCDHKNKIHKNIKHKDILCFMFMNIINHVLRKTPSSGMCLRISTGTEEPFLGLRSHFLGPRSHFY